MKFLFKPKPPAATAADHREQHAHARAALDSANAEVAKARASFDASGSPEALEALTQAKAVAAAASEHVERATRLLEASTAREAAETKAKLEAQHAELLAQLSPAALVERRREALARQVGAFEAVLDAYDQRAAVEREIDDIESKLLAIETKLGTAQRTHRESQFLPPLWPIADALNVYRGEQSAQRKKLLSKLIFMLKEPWL